MACALSVAQLGAGEFQSPTLFVSADLVVLAAGTLGSTEILLRSKSKGLATSDHVGRRFTGNGDVLGFGYNTDRIIEGIGFAAQPPQGRAPVGPCISGLIDIRRQPNLDDGIVVEEGSILAHWPMYCRLRLPRLQKCPTRRPTVSPPTLSGKRERWTAVFEVPITARYGERRPISS